MRKFAFKREEDVNGFIDANGNQCHEFTIKSEYDATREFR
jgi:hypothetical protein